MSKRPAIECKSNGPYLVKDLPQLTNWKGESIPPKPVMALCRCGGSAAKPFCDGTHQRNGFSGAKLGGLPDRRDSYRGRRITLHDNRSICSHAGHCTDGLPSVFKYGAEPWIDVDGAAAEAIIEAVRNCPSGALSYSIDDIPPPEEPREPVITITKDGPYAVAGDVELIGGRWAHGASSRRYTLCRCGGSKNKPFCDGTHWSIGFKG
jgi:CDGSH-type Zn-finger protein/ferredoxin